MKISKLGSAGIKLAGAVSCGVGSALTLYAALMPSRGGSGFLYATGAGLAGSGLVLLGQSVRDTIDAFKSPSDGSE